MNNLIKKAFTLIELLVVIAIIGILSGLIIVGMNGMTNKANLAKAQVFSNSLRNSLMMNTISEWRFDELSTAVNGTTIQDSWGNVNSGTIYTGSGDVSDKIRTDCVSGKCLYFDGTDDYVNVGTNSILRLGNSGTISAWIYPMVDFSAVRIIYTSNGGADVDKPPYFRLDGGRLAAHFGNGTTVQGAYSNLYLTLDKWQFAVVSWDGTTAKFYLDTALYSTPQTSSVSFTGTTYNIGVYSPNTARIFNGKIDDVRIYNAAIPVSQILEQYCAGLNKLLISGGVSKEEYLSRISQIAINE